MSDDSNCVLSFSGELITHTQQTPSSQLLYNLCCDPQAFTGLYWSKQKKLVHTHYYRKAEVSQPGSSFSQITTVQLLVFGLCLCFLTWLGDFWFNTEMTHISILRFHQVIMQWPLQIFHQVISVRSQRCVNCMVTWFSAAVFVSNLVTCIYTSSVTLGQSCWMLERVPSADKRLYSWIVRQTRWPFTFAWFDDDCRSCLRVRVFIAWNMSEYYHGKSLQLLQEDMLIIITFIVWIFMGKIEVLMPLQCGLCSVIKTIYKTILLNIWGNRSFSCDIYGLLRC